VDKKVIHIFKPEGLTSLQALHRLRKKYPKYKEVKLGYAGTLDPLAEGVLIILVGDENKKRREYIRLPKKYVFSYILGMSTDTYDVLGLPKDGSHPKKVNEKNIVQILEKYTGTIIQKYPPYSSKRVSGKPLFTWARNGKINNIDIPNEERAIHKLSLEEVIPLSAQQLKGIIFSKIKKVSGNFRQRKVLNEWEKYFDTHVGDIFYIVSAQVYCSSGTYVRGLVHDIGQDLGSSATTLHITRTHVGDFTLRDSKKIE
tara:strand:- start:13878 stop:14648 length:771 start_codon:yes stop_codon:yes gene_type:complete